MPDLNPKIPNVEASMSLRQEIVESQKTQADFLKWKLISVASIGAIAFGLVSDPKLATSASRLLLCLIPVTCAYVDLISLHIMIRIITLGAYLKAQGDTYEEYVFAIRNRSKANPFIFEAAALHGSSIFFNMVVVAASFFLPRGIDPWTDNARYAYIIAGLAGIGWSVFLWVLYAWRVSEVVRLTSEILKLPGMKQTQVGT